MKNSSTNTTSTRALGESTTDTHVTRPTNLEHSSARKENASTRILMKSLCKKK